MGISSLVLQAFGRKPKQWTTGNVDVMMFSESIMSSPCRGHDGGDVSVNNRHIGLMGAAQGRPRAHSGFILWDHEWLHDLYSQLV